jgi:hypothetical protein
VDWCVLLNAIEIFAFEGEGLSCLVMGVFGSSYSVARALGCEGVVLEFAWCFPNAVTGADVNGLILSGYAR